MFPRIFSLFEEMLLVTRLPVFTEAGCDVEREEMVNFASEELLF